MSSITVIPTPLAQRATAAANPRNASTCGLYDVAGRLGQAHKSEAYIIRTVDQLVETLDFPAPLPLVLARSVMKSAHRDSRWPTAAVEAWFLDRLPPSARGLIAQAERATVDSTLAARAMRMFGGDAA